jgi:hypothetical protein
MVDLILKKFTQSHLSHALDGNGRLVAGNADLMAL